MLDYAVTHHNDQDTILTSLLVARGHLSYCPDIRDFTNTYILAWQSDRPAEPVFDGHAYGNPDSKCSTKIDFYQALAGLPINRGEVPKDYATNFDVPMMHPAWLTSGEYSWAIRRGVYRLDLIEGLSASATEGPNQIAAKIRNDVILLFNNARQKNAEKVDRTLPTFDIA